MQERTAGLSQEQLAEKLCVSRQAITKWESDKGIPDIENLQNISKLFGVSIDSLLDDGDEDVPPMSLRKASTWTIIMRKGNSSQSLMLVVKSKYPDADSIFPLVRRKNLSLVEKMVDFVVMPGVLHTADSLNDLTSYYLVESQGKQYLVNVTKEFIESRELVRRFTGRSQIIGKDYFTKALYADLVTKGR